MPALANTRDRVRQKETEAKPRQGEPAPHGPRAGRARATCLTRKEMKMSTPATIRQIRLERRLPAYWRVTFDHPPLNIFGPDTIPQLNEIVTAIETDADVKVVVFDSAVEGFFLTHYDFLAKMED